MVGTGHVCQEVTRRQAGKEGGNDLLTDRLGDKAQSMDPEEALQGQKTGMRNLRSGDCFSKLDRIRGGRSAKE